jgi:outer membrane protein, heavy metal efflux system
MHTRLILFALSLSLAAQDVPRGRLEPLLAEALRRNPEILAARKKLEAMRQKPAMERSLPDPMVSLSYASVNGPFPGQGLGREPQSNIGFMVSQTLPAHGKLRLRAAIASKEASGMEQDYWMAELSVVSRMKQAWHKLHHSYEMLDLLDRNRELLERMTKIAEARYALGKAAQQDVLRSQTQMILLEARREKYEQELQSRVAEINSLLARPLDTPVARPYDVEPAEPFVSLEALYRQAEAHAPVLAKEKSGVERAELALNLARKDGAIDYTVGGGVATMGSMGTMYQAKLDFNLPLFTRSRQRAAVLEQVSEVERARRSYQATGNQMLFRIKDDWLQSSASWRLMRLYSTTMVPQATITLESSLTAYENGQIDFMNVLASLMSVLDAEMAYHEESLNYHLALLRLEETAGVPLVNDDPPENAPGGQTTGTGNGLTDTVNHRSLTVAAPSQTGATPKEEQR